MKLSYEVNYVLGGKERTSNITLDDKVVANALRQGTTAKTQRKLLGAIMQRLPIGAKFVHAEVK